MRYLLALVVMGTFTQMALAAGTERREASAHAHGYGAINIAIEGDQLMMELGSPGYDIVGFEHAANSAEDKAKWATAKKMLGDATNVVMLPASAGCKQVAAVVELRGGEDQGGHVEFHINYEFKCSRMLALTKMTFTYFKSFIRARELDIAVITAKGQKKFEVEPAKPTISLAGLM